MPSPLHRLLACATVATFCVAPAFAETADVAAALPSFGASVGRTALALGVLLVSLALAARFLPRWLAARARTGTPRNLEVVETCRLDAKRSLYLVRVLSKPWIVSVSEHGTTLHPAAGAPDAPAAPDAPGTPGATFQTLFERTAARASSGD